MPKKAPSGWHPERIKTELRLKFGPITMLAVEWGFARAAISRVLGQPGYSVRLERRIAEALGVDPHELWPFRWSRDGRPLPPPREFEPIETSRVRSSQIGRAA